MTMAKAGGAEASAMLKDDQEVEGQQTWLKAEEKLGIMIREDRNWIAVRFEAFW